MCGLLKGIQNSTSEIGNKVQNQAIQLCNPGIVFSYYFNVMKEACSRREECTTIGAHA